MHSILAWPLWNEYKKIEDRDISYCTGLDNARNVILHFLDRKSYNITCLQNAGGQQKCGR